MVLKNVTHPIPTPFNPHLCEGWCQGSVYQNSPLAVSRSLASGWLVAFVLYCLKLTIDKLYFYDKLHCYKFVRELNKVS